MPDLTNKDIDKLKVAGFKSYEISHYKAGRFSRISKVKLNKIRGLIGIKKKRKKSSYPKPISITKMGIKLKKTKNIIIINL